MRKILKQALCLTAVAPGAIFASPLAYPAPGMWHYTVGADTGVMNYDMAGYINSASTDNIARGAAYTIGLNQSVGYGRWFYLQAKESGATSITCLQYNDDIGGQDQRARVSFFDAEIRAYFPLSLSSRSMVTLQPNIGWGTHIVNLRARGNAATTLNTWYSRYRSVAFAPIVGLALGCDVTQNFNFRFGVAIEILNFKHRGKTSPTAVASGWTHLRQRRGGVSSALDLNYKLSSLLDLTGNVEYLNYNPSESIGAAAPSAVDNGFMNRFTYKMGVRWKF